MEIWVPYGEVESLLTLQAENLGELVDPAPEGHAEETAQLLKERIRGFQRLVVCDRRPATLKLLRVLAAHLPQDDVPSLHAPSPKAIEEGVPDLKGRFTRLSSPSVEKAAGEYSVRLAPELLQGKTIFLATGAPDPLFGFADARVSASLSFVSGARRFAFDSRDGDGISQVEETKPYLAVASLLNNGTDNSYLTVMTRGGEPYSVIDGGPNEARGHLLAQQVNPAKGIVVGGGGRGYDDTFSGVLRLAMSSLKAVRKGGDILLVGECPEGIGSEALQMQAQGRISDAALRRGFYAEGMEEIGYLNNLRENYTINLLSSLPDLYVSSRFRFRASKSAPEALQKVFASIGRGAKLHVFTRSPETFLS